MKPKLKAKFDEAFFMCPAVPAEQIEELYRQTDDYIAELNAAIESKQDELKWYKQRVANLERKLYGKASERRNSKPYSSASEPDSSKSEPERPTEPASKTCKSKAASEKTPQTRNHAFPSELPREDHTHTLDDPTCPMGHHMQPLPEPKVSEQLCVRPPSLFVRRHLKTSYKCSICGDEFKTAQVPSVIKGGRYHHSFLVDILVGKFCDFLPFERQRKRFRRQGLDVSRATLSRFATAGAKHIFLLCDVFKEFILAAASLAADETRVPTLCPGRGETAIYWGWAYARDERRWNPNAPAVYLFEAEESRSGEHPQNFLEDFAGFLLVDGYTGYLRLTKEDRVGGPLELAFCNVHARRKFDEALTAMPESRDMDEGLRRYAEIFAIEATTKGLPPKRREKIRQARLHPLFESFRNWCDLQLEKLTVKKQKDGIAYRYFLKHYVGLTLFIEDGRLEIDNNSVENAMRAIALLRKNSLFAGNDLGAKVWMAYASIIQTCHVNNIDPAAYLMWFFDRVAEGYPKERYHELLPWLCPVGHLDGRKPGDFDDGGLWERPDPDPLAMSAQSNQARKSR